jgi:hypothetical protein
MKNKSINEVKEFDLESFCSMKLDFATHFPQEWIVEMRSCIRCWTEALRGGED